jgi:zinc transport system substrate-binding protein
LGLDGSGTLIGLTLSMSTFTVPDIPMRYLLVPLLLALCAPLPARTLVASVEPLAMVLRDLYGDSAEVVTLLEANQNPHNPMLSPRQMLTLRRADLLVWLGEAAEPAVASLAAKRDGDSLALLSLPGVTRREGGHRHDGEHDHGHHHEPGELDPHLWLDPRNMAVLAEALGARYTLPEGQPAAFLADLEQTEAALRERLAPVADTPWLTFHHPWGYFQQRLDLRAPVIISEQLGAGPSSRRFVALAQQLEAEQVRCAILEPEAQPDLVARLCPDCQRVALDPLGRDVPARGQGDDYSRWLSERVAAGFATCLAP